MTAETPARGEGSSDAVNVTADSKRWAKVATDAATADVSKDALRLLIVLSAHANRSRLAWPSQETLARRLGWITESTNHPDRRRVSRALRNLVNAQLIREVGRHRHGKRAWTSQYEVSPYGEDAYESHASSGWREYRDPARDLPRMGRDPAFDISPPDDAYKTG